MVQLRNMRVIPSILILFCFTFQAFAQNDSLLRVIEKHGLHSVEQLKKGDIEVLKDLNPQEGAWEFSDFEDYKRAVLNDELIVYGSFIQKSSAEDNLYGFNFYAISMDRKESIYFYAIVLSYTIVDGVAKSENGNFIATTKPALKQWWMSSFSYCMRNKLLLVKNTVGAECHPPPFQE